MSHPEERIRRFTARHIIHHAVMLVCFAGLVATGLPQRYAAQTWAKGLVLVFGGVERTRAIHHFLGTVMALQLVWHLIEALWFHFVRRFEMPMLPLINDIRDFYQQVRFNLGLVAEPPQMERYTFAEKIEYLALVWGTVLMVMTGIILLFPVRFASLMAGEWIIAAKAAHGGEALLAFLSILTWHAYFVHVRHWNTSIVNGLLEEEAYVEEHPLELQRIRRGEVQSPAPISKWRLTVFVAAAAAVVGAVLLLLAWLRGRGIAIPTITAFRFG
ncbi:MAG: cytochrome C [Acidobacteria bacterium]|nr:cytochrome C [Acidobacteriota bacterium]